MGRMRAALRFADAGSIISGLRDEIHRSAESRYDHRLHAVLLVAQGITCPQAARLLGVCPRSVELWFRRFERGGLEALAEGPRAGRPRRLSEEQLEELDRALRQTPHEIGLTGARWTGSTLSAWIEQRFQVRLGVCQCQRLLRRRAGRHRRRHPGR